MGNLGGMYCIGIGITNDDYYQCGAGEGNGDVIVGGIKNTLDNKTSLILSTKDTKIYLFASFVDNALQINPNPQFNHALKRDFEEIYRTGGVVE